ncbi:MAG TPA: hypothetical protein DDZ39_00725, partial [Flavobacteriaceae bacterium]|nr:hypothetical protein [Flavobacteriaceae bacterium]
DKKLDKLESESCKNTTLKATKLQITNAEIDMESNMTITNVAKESTCKPKSFNKIVKETIKKSQKKPEFNTLVIKPINDKDVETEFNKIKVSLTKDCSKAPINKLTKTKDCIVIKSENKDAITLINNAINKNDEIKCKSNIVDKIEAKLFIYDVFYVQKDEVVQEIINKNPSIEKLVNEGEVLECIYENKRNETQNFCIKVGPSIREYIKKNGNSIFIGYQKCSVKDYFYVKQCYKCQMFGHLSNECKNETTCLYCGKEHKSKECGVKMEKDKYNCINCKKNKLSNDHTSNSKYCPIYQKVLQRVINMTNLAAKN